VSALARSARRIPVDHPKLKKMAGDALETATVKRALTGVDRKRHIPVDTLSLLLALFFILPTWRTG